MKQLIHTPEGVRDIYGQECDRKRYLRRRIEKLFRSYGYQSIETPTFEFFEVFGKEVGTTPSRSLYKFFDREGSTLVLRPDFTPSIARAAAMYFQEEDMPIRLCYQGRVYSNNNSYQGRLKESSQIGIELLNDNSPEADAEAVALAVFSMQRAGLTDFQLTISDAGFYGALTEEAGISPEQAEALKQQLILGNRFGAQELIENMNLPEEIESFLLQLPDLIGGEEVLERAAALSSNARVQDIIARLKKINIILQDYDAASYITYDLSMVSEYKYYTGILMQAFTYGSGSAVLKGGRYDSLLEHFGKKAAAIGFGVDLDGLYNALERQGIDLPVTDIKKMVLYPAELKGKAVRYASACREAGQDVACVLRDAARSEEDYINYGKRNQFAEIICLCAEDQAKVISLTDGKERTCDI